ncbi:MAG: DUF2283 domain-containing protein [Candidatus Saccharibacteria bacterium]
MKFTYDKETDAAYILFVESAQVSETLDCADVAQKVEGELLFDIDKDGHIVGIEILDAKDVLPDSLLQQS